MLLMVVVASMRLGHVHIVMIEEMSRIITHMTIVVMGHICTHIGLVMTQKNWFWAGIIAWPISIVIW